MDGFPLNWIKPIANSLRMGLFLFFDGQALVWGWVNFPNLWPHNPVQMKLKCSPESSLLSTVISLVYKDKWWFDENMSVIFCTENLTKNSFIPSSHRINLENFVMQLKRQYVEAWQNEKHYSKGNNTRENSIPRQEISNQSTMWSTKVRSGSNICCLCSSLLELSSCRVTYKNCHKSSVFFNQV